MLIDNNGTVKKVLFVVFFLVTIAVLWFFHLREIDSCMGIPLITEAELEEYQPSDSLDLTSLLLNEERAPFDLYSKTLYLSQPTTALNHYYEMVGTIKSQNPENQLYFLKDEALLDLKGTLSSNVPLSLVVTREGYYEIVNVVLTTLPVISMNGSETTEPAQQGYVSAGSFEIFSGFDPSSQSFSVSTSFAQWHIRGQTSTVSPKKSFKISLKDDNEENKDLNLLGMGSDDDWILNAMVFDDTKVREKSIMSFWNAFLETEGQDYRMSCGEYVEVLINREYRGLYLLQRRVDAKYLDIDKRNDILLKGTTDGYEVISSPFDQSSSTTILENIMYRQTGGTIDWPAFVDVNLLLNYTVALDNWVVKNMYYLLKYTDDGYVLYFIPWDMDMTLGLCWLDGGYAYDPDYAMSNIVCRNEYYVKENNPEQLDVAFAARWKELRSTVYTEENFLPILEYNYNVIHDSGALSRDRTKWGTYYGDGVDVQENLYNFARERLEYLDGYYAAF